MKRKDYLALKVVGRMYCSAQVDLQEMSVSSLFPVFAERMTFIYYFCISSSVSGIVEHKVLTSLIAKY